MVQCQLQVQFLLRVMNPKPKLVSHQSYPFAPLCFFMVDWFCIQIQSYLSTCGACLEVVVEFGQRATYFCSLRVTRCSTSWHAKMSLTLDERI